MTGSFLHTPREAMPHQDGGQCHITVEWGPGCSLTAPFFERPFVACIDQTWLLSILMAPSKTARGSWRGLHSYLFHLLFTFSFIGSWLWLLFPTPWGKIATNWERVMCQQRRKVVSGATRSMNTGERWSMGLQSLPTFSLKNLHNSQQSESCSSSEQFHVMR